MINYLIAQHMMLLLDLVAIVRQSDHDKDLELLRLRQPVTY